MKEKGLPSLRSKSRRSLQALAGRKQAQQKSRE
jgi:hypothetical protein